MTSRVPDLHQVQRGTNKVQYLHTARRAFVHHSFIEAFKYYVMYFNSLEDPSESSLGDQENFTTIVGRIGMVLEEVGDTEELLKCYLQAINLFPNNHHILTYLGIYMFKVGQTDIAERYLTAALRVNNRYLPAEKNLMFVKWHQIPRWHFRMLNDKSRNTAYRNAIHEVISKGYHNVIDIGAGCGLLSLMASNNPSANVLAIEENKTLHKMCTDILKENNVNNVHCLNTHSITLLAPPCKCNLLVTEIFDVALFGERALETIYHASNVLCTEADYRIIPCGAKLYVTGIASDELSKKSWYMSCDSSRLLNLRPFSVRQRNPEPYEAEDLATTDVKYVTDTQQAFHVNFYNRDQMVSMLTNKDYKENIYLNCKKGKMIALAVWFDLNLTQNITITTNPLNAHRTKCWEQAIFYLERPLLVDDGEVLPVKVSLSDCKLRCSIPTCKTRYIDVSKEVISFMNDKNLVDTIVRVASSFTHKNLVVVDYHVFPLFGFLMAKNNNSTIYHVTRNDADINFIKHVLAINGIPPERFLFILNNGVFSPMINVNQECVHFFDPIKADGSLRNVVFRNFTNSDIMLRIPHKLMVNVKLIYSSYTEFCNKVDDDNVFGFKIGKYMNQYSGNEQPNLEKFPFISYADPVCFPLSVDGFDYRTVTIKKTGLVNAMYFWYHMYMYNDIIYSTSSSSHYRRSCFFLDEPVHLTEGDTRRITLKIDGSFMKMTLN